jgi:hypothetical protein
MALQWVSAHVASRQHWIAAQDWLVCGLDGGTGIDAEFIGELEAYAVVGPHRFRLAAGAVEGKHQLGGKLLVERGAAGLGTWPRMLDT